jgi:hypothetical protein
MFFSHGITGFALIEVADWAMSRSGLPYSAIYADMERFRFDRICVFAGHGGLMKAKAVRQAALPVECNILFAKHKID